MNILSRITWRAMRENKTRTVVTIIGVILSAALFVSVTTLGVSFWNYLVRGVVYSTGDCFLEYEAATDSDLEALEGDSRVSQIADIQVLGHVENRQLAAVNQVFLDTMPVHLIEGRLPQSSKEILLTGQYVQELQETGRTIAVGDTITFSVNTLDADYSYNYDIAYTYEQKNWEQTYTVVGIYERHMFGLEHINFSRFLTLADGDQGEALWHHLFIKTNPASAAYALTELDGEGKPLYGECCHRNEALLNYYGATQFQNVNLVIVLVVSVLLALIMLASVNLINNAFFISLSERTKQFGLLSSIGATRKQIRASLLFEALAVCLIGIPIGLTVGYAGVAVAIGLLRDQINAIFSVGEVRAVYLTAMPSVFGFASAALISALTVFLSAWIPAKRAASISALEAIRQTKDYRASPKTVRAGKITRKLFGIPGVMAVKYFKVSKKKYRTTVRALAFSMVLFIVATYFAASVSKAVEGSTGQEAYDFLIHSEDAALLQELRETDGVTESAVTSSANSSYFAVLPAASLDDSHKQVLTAYEDSLSPEDPYFLTAFRFCYLEDRELETFLTEQGIDPAPYLDPEEPAALVLSPYQTVRETMENGSETFRVYQYSPLTEEVTQMSVYSLGGYPDALEEGLEGSVYHEDIVLPDGSLGLSIVSYVPMGDGIMGPDESTRRYYKIEVIPGETSACTFRYYEYDMQTGKTGSCVASAENEMHRVRIGQAVSQIPFGVSSQSMYGTVTLVLPLSAASEAMSDQTSLAIKVSDYVAVKSRLNRVEQLNFHYEDYAQAQRDARGMVFLVSVFSACFVVLISLISAANVFNTISTNITLRRREFGMLKSVGMKTKEMARMMVYECLIYGGRAILWGLPLAAALSYGCYYVLRGVLTTAYQLPVAAMCLAAAGAFAMVFLSMGYSVGKLKDNNPIEAIRMENI